MKQQVTKQIETSLDKERQKVLRKFFDLNDKALKHLQESAVAVMICSYCTADGTAAKKDEDGKCLNCHGTNQVPDMKRRDWSFEEIASRTLPKPKSVEMAVDDKRGTETFVKELAGKSDKEIEALVSSLGVNFTAE